MTRITRSSTLNVVGEDASFIEHQTLCGRVSRIYIGLVPWVVIRYFSFLLDLKLPQRALGSAHCC